MTTKEIKKLIKEAIKEEITEGSQAKEAINEMRVRDLKEISLVVDKDDFYAFINSGNNIIRDLESSRDVSACKKYLIYLVKNNIM
tara:strand:- start:352 stop:606 length:255 start_codon:yes stop_codon:yes gene_type:complete